MKKTKAAPTCYSLVGACLLIIVLILPGCESEPETKQAGQALVSVDGVEITMLQLNDELNRTRARIQPDQLEVAKKQLVESMINRQLMQAEAQRNNLDRTPGVMQAIARARTEIIAQAYMQSILSNTEKPTKEEIDAFYQEHPGFFSQRKHYNLSILRFATKDQNAELESVIDTAKSITDVAKWMDKHNVSYEQDEAARSTTEMHPEMSALLAKKAKGELFLLNENEYSLLFVINAVEAQPLTADQAGPQIERHLLNMKHQEIMKSALTNLRASANIEYLHTSVDNVDQTDSQAALRPTAETEHNPLGDDNTALNNLLQNDSIERGITGLK
ncbi:MAG: EpsD family peptidyl-prolyl cis-trans isomerase [Nitrosomonas sp.]|nr:EpsD family peptidyl-prolyl cis-trans isomerase [Nitrosomonas sp.]